MCIGGNSVCVCMRPLQTFMFALCCSVIGLGSSANAGTPSLSEAIPAYSRDARGISLAVSELLPSIDNCVTAHQALGGVDEVALDIAFDVSPAGEVAELSIESKSLPTTGLDSCIEGTLSAMRFAPGEVSIPVEMPLTASTKVQSTLN